MPNNITEQQKKQASLYICNALSITSKRKFEKELKTNLELQNICRRAKKSTIETTREFSTLRPSDELLQGSRNLLKGRIQAIDNKQTTNSFICNHSLNKIKNGVTSIIKVRQPVWAVATYIVIGLIAGRLLLGPGGDKPIDMNGKEI